MARALIRQRIIDIWEKQDEVIKDSFCCPECRCILEHADKEEAYCPNEMCLNENYYNIRTGEEIHEL